MTADGPNGQSAAANVMHWETAYTGWRTFMEVDLLSARFADLLSRSWKYLLLRGIAAIAFGVLTWMRPGISVLALTFMFGAYAFVDGALATWTGIQGRRTADHWGVLLLVGLIGIVVGVTTFLMPMRTAWTLLLIIGVWAIARGVLEITAGVYARKEIQGEWVLILAGIVSILFGSLLLAHPLAGLLATLWLVAAYGVIAGVLLVFFAFRARHFAHHPTMAI